MTGSRAHWGVMVCGKVAELELLIRRTDAYYCLCARE